MFSYCAIFLLLCLQSYPTDRDVPFPTLIRIHAAWGNLEDLGLSCWAGIQSCHITVYSLFPSLALSFLDLNREIAEVCFCFTSVDSQILC